MDRQKTAVCFLVGEDGEVFAFFPRLFWNYAGDRVSYAHVGQHGPASVEYARECREAAPAEYAALARELRGIGYNLRIAGKECVA